MPLLLFTTFVVVVKFRFEHYNLMFPIVAMCILAFLLKKHNLSRDFRIVFWALLTINFLCFVFPDRTLYKLRKSHRYFWSEEPLDLSHFKIKKNMENDTVAIVNPTVGGAISRVYNYPPAILFASDRKNHSWIDTFQFNNTDVDNKLLERTLQHEKRHLDIMEIYIRGAQDSLDKMIFYSYDQKYEVVEHFFRLSEKVQRAFDAETDNGTIDKEVEKWDKRITEQLSQNSF
ncbi:hypothetical protein L0P88_22145 [Muricauda sp. SCSIO 64092]|uniref:hypothetical protein n=1 Tax=Allomuricauda sp. SCSIO 64092 TaxID=2908842 RepID=UPI001FF6BE41|nr:hypothetical protein [Muricauda sp. SCSIO 64092]UOY06611.1 hypothetical protein L0P88_22145 [Muricauda sp. SCSIO 64092]